MVEWVLERSLRVLVVAWCTHVALVVVVLSSWIWFPNIHSWYVAIGDGEDGGGGGVDGEGVDDGGGGASRPASAIWITCL